MHRLAWHDICRLDRSGFARLSGRRQVKVHAPAKEMNVILILPENPGAERGLFAGSQALFKRP